jgi:hypothetical protein
VRWLVEWTAECRQRLRKGVQRLGSTVQWLREAIQRHGQRVVGRLRASGWRKLVLQSWLFWVGVGVLLLGVIGVVYGIAMDLLSVLPALVFVVTLFLASFLHIARVVYPSGTSFRYRIFEGFYWLAASYIPAYFMFALTADLPRNWDLKKLQPFLATQTRIVAGGGQAVLADFEKAARYKSANPPTKEHFVEICKPINWLGQAPLARRTWPIERATWIEYLFDRRHRSNQATEKLFRYMTFLDSEHIRLITKIEDSTLFKQLDEFRASHLSGIPFVDRDLTFLAPDLYSYYGLTRQLQQYADRHLKGLAWSEPRD